MRFFLSGIFLFPLQVLVGQSLNWGEILKGNPLVYRKYHISTAESYKNNILLRKAVYDKYNNQTVFLNGSLDTLYTIEYDNKDRACKISRNGQLVLLSYYDEGNHIKTMSAHTNHFPVDTLRVTSFPYINKWDHIQNEIYCISKASGDTLSKSKRLNAYIINEQDSSQNYFLEITDSIIIKKYNSQYRGTTKIIHHNGYYSLDSILSLGQQKYHSYHYIVYPDSVIQTIRKDSLYSLKIIKGKLTYKKNSYLGKDRYEIFYNEDSSIRQQINYKYYPDKFGNEVLWEKTTFDGSGKKTAANYPNKKYYKLKQGKLMRRAKKFPKLNLTMCEGITSINIQYDYRIWLISASLFYQDTLEKSFVGNMFPFKDYLLQTLYNNNILNDENQVYYSKWTVTQSVSVEKNNLPDIDILSNKIILPLKEVNTGSNKTNEYYIKLAAEDGKEINSPGFAQNEVEALSHEALLSIFIYFKMQKSSGS